MYSRQDVQNMKRAELQALCKTNKLKANGKTEVLVEMLLEHFNLSSTAETGPSTARKAARKPLNAVGPNHTKAPGTTKKRSLPVASTFLPSPQKPCGGVNDDDDDEMRLQTPVAIRAKKVSTHNTLLKRALESSFTPATRPRAAVQTQATKKIINALLATVDTLKAELATTRSTLTRLESTTNFASGPSTPPLKRAEVLALVNERIKAHRAQVDTSIKERFGTVTAQLAELSKAIELATSREERESIIRLRDALEEEVKSNQEWRRELEGSFETLRSNLTGHFGTSAPTSSISPARALSGSAPQSPAHASPTDLDSFTPSSPTLEPIAPNTPIAASGGATASALASPAPICLAPTPAPNLASPVMSDGAPLTTTLASFSSLAASPRRTPRTRASHKPSPSMPTPTTLIAGAVEPALALPLHMLSHVSPSKNATSPRGRASSPRASPRRSLASTSTPATATIVAMSPARSVVRSIGKRSRRQSDIGDVSVDDVDFSAGATPSRAMGASDVLDIKGLSGGRARKRMRISTGVENQVEQEKEEAEESTSESEQDDEEVTELANTSGAGTFDGGDQLSEQEDHEAPSNEVPVQAQGMTLPAPSNTPREFFVSTNDEDGLALLRQVSCSIAHCTSTAGNAPPHPHDDLSISHLCRCFESSHFVNPCPSDAASQQNALRDREDRGRRGRDEIRRRRRQSGRCGNGTPGKKFEWTGFGLFGEA
ncbi:BQ2448_3364 [Microbotryum intermedium]|uniref:BQ2448_3364 protein n=1 Tax=Microbotryum intermedium TaxID=269621 RepID=A0A238F9Q6_9BASI|nr:BQ2448_3364 [Microbotryum intermedium]